MKRFYLRDLFWLILAVAVGLSSWLSGELTGRRNEVADAEQRRKAMPPPPPPPPPPPSPGTIGLILKTSDNPYFNEPLERIRNLYAEPHLPLEAPDPERHPLRELMEFRFDALEVIR